MLFRYPSVFLPVTLLLVSFLPDVFSNLPQTLPPRLWQSIFTAVLMTFQNSLLVTSIHFVQHTYYVHKTHLQLFEYFREPVIRSVTRSRVTVRRSRVSRGTSIILPADALKAVPWERRDPASRCRNVRM